MNLSFLLSTEHNKSSLGICLKTAYAAGFSAACKAKGLHENEYTSGTPEYKSWVKGWEAFYVE